MDIQDGGGGAAVPTTQRHVEARLGKDGELGSVYLRRRKNSQVDKIMSAAGLRPNDTAAAQRYAIKTVQYGIVNAVNLKDEETGQSVAFATEAHPTLGPIAAESVIDAISVEDIGAIFAYMEYSVKLPERMQAK